MAKYMNRVVIKRKIGVDIRDLIPNTRYCVVDLRELQLRDWVINSCTPRDAFRRNLDVQESGVTKKYIDRTIHPYQFYFFTSESEARQYLKSKLTAFRDSAQKQVERFDKLLKQLDHNE